METVRKWHLTKHWHQDFSYVNKLLCLHDCHMTTVWKISVGMAVLVNKVMERKGESIEPVNIIAFTVAHHLLSQECYHQVDFALRGKTTEMCCTKRLQ